MSDHQFPSPIYNVKVTTLTQNSHIIRLKGFETVACLIASIGNNLDNGGRADLLADLGVYAASTVEKNAFWKTIQESSSSSYSYI